MYEHLKTQPGEHEKQMRSLAELAIENAECGAQFEITDNVLRDALLDSITQQLLKASKAKINAAK